MELFGPLVHFDLPLEPVAVFRDNAELLVTKILTITRPPRYMHQAVVVILVWLLMVHRNACFARTSNQLCESNSLLFILPEQDLGKRNQE